MKNLFVLVIGLISLLNVNAQGIVSADEIIEKINKGENVIYENVIIEGDLDFTQAKKTTYEKIDLDMYAVSGIEDIYDRTSDNYYVEIDSKVEFISCEFEGKITGYRADEEKNIIYNARFNDVVQFANCTFSDDVNFKYSVFTNETEFESSFVEGVGEFTYAKFDALADFSRTSFEAYNSFNCANFNDLAVFQSTEFHAMAKFGQAVFADAVYFTKSTFTDKALFTYAKFKKAVFNNAKFDQEGIFNYAEFSKSAEFINAKFNAIAAFDNANFEEVSFKGTNFNIIPKFSNTLVNNMDIFSYILQN